VATGLYGAVIAEAYVQAPMKFSNVLSISSTAATGFADYLAGDTNLQQGVIGKNTKNSLTTTALGAIVPEAITNFAIQSLALSNDLGWSSLPFQ
jgi:hypothetical protein